MHMAFEVKLRFSRAFLLPPKIESKVWVCKNGESMNRFCCLPCKCKGSQQSEALLSISVTLVTAPHEYSMRMVPVGKCV